MEGSIRTLVVGVGTVAELDPVLPEAMDLASRTGAQLHVAHFFELPPAALAHAAGEARGAEPHAAEDCAAALRSRLHQQVLQFRGPKRVRLHVREGPPGPRLCALAAVVDADLLVVGATRRGRLQRNVLGTTATRVLARATAPVLVCHAPFFHEVRRVLLATDLSELSAEVHERSLDAVEALFGTSVAEVRGLVVVEDHLASLYQAGSDALERTALAGVQRFLVDRLPRALAVEAKSRVGEPAREISLEAADWDADLVVVGAHGRPRAGRFRLGSVAAAMLRGTTRNVLVIPAGRTADVPVRRSRSESAAALV
jgi:nucleotide-binding universal stress UspA family protein